MSEYNWYQDFLATVKRQADAQERIAAVLEGIVSARVAKNAESKARDRELMDLLQLRREGKI